MLVSITKGGGEPPWYGYQIHHEALGLTDADMLRVGLVPPLGGVAMSIPEALERVAGWLESLVTLWDRLQP